MDGLHIGWTRLDKYSGALYKHGMCAWHECIPCRHLWRAVLSGRGQAGHVFGGHCGDIHGQARTP